MQSAGHHVAEASAVNTRDVKAGTLPTRKNTVAAEVLAYMLDGRELTAMDSVFAHSTTRLASVVFDLGKRHGWRIERCEKPVDTKDGRTAMVAAYWLSDDVREAAFASGARTWINDVKVVATARRNGA